MDAVAGEEGRIGHPLQPEAPDPVLVRRDVEQPAAQDVAAGRVLVEELLVVELFRVGIAHPKVDHAGIEPLRVAHVDDRVHARADHGRDDQVGGGVEREEVRLLVDEASTPRILDLGGQEARPARRRRVGVPEDGRVENRYAEHADHRVAVVDHLMLAVLDDPAGADRPARRLGGAILRADVAGGVDGVVQLVDDVVAPYRGAGGQGGVARLAGGEAERDGGAELVVQRDVVAVDHRLIRIDHHGVADRVRCAGDGVVDQLVGAQGAALVAGLDVTGGGDQAVRLVLFDHVRLQEEVAGAEAVVGDRGGGRAVAQVALRLSGGGGVAGEQSNAGQ